MSVKAQQNVYFLYAVPAGSLISPGAGPQTYTAGLADGSALPGWLRFDPSSITFSGTPPRGADTSTLMLRVTATDSVGGTASADIAVTVHAPNRVVFGAQDPVSGSELWVSDGTRAGTGLLKDIDPGPDRSSLPDSFVSLGDGRLMFVATDQVNRREIWVTDGTEAGTVIVRNDPAGNAGFGPEDLVSLGNGTLIFRGPREPDVGREPWTSDGTAAGTTLVKDIFSSPAFGGSQASGFVPLGNGKVVFVAQESSPVRGLWVTDGTAAGTGLLAQFGSFPQGLTSLQDGRLVFWADAGQAGLQLWVSDGTQAGTRPLISTVDAMGQSYAPYGTVIGNGQVVFIADTGNGSRGLWITDGTPEGSRRWHEVEDALGAGVAYEFRALGNGRLLFTAEDSLRGGELWVTDGTQAGTLVVKDIAEGAASSYPTDFTALGNGQFVFSAYEPTTGRELWVTDGTSQGTTLVKDLFEGTVDSSPRYFVEFRGATVLFVAYDSQGHAQLWVTDGTPEGTRLVDDFGGASFDPNVIRPTAVYFDLPNASPSNTVPADQTLDEDAVLSFSVANGNALQVADADGDVLTAVIDVSAGRLTLNPVSPDGVTVAGNGTARLVIGGEAAALNAALDGLQYTAAADFHGDVTLRLATSDAKAAEVVSTVAVSVSAVSDIVDDTAFTQRGQAVVVDVLQNDDFEDSARRIVAVDGQTLLADGAAVAVANGTVSLTAGGDLRFAPTGGYRGQTSFAYTAGSAGLQETARVSVTVVDALGAAEGDALQGGAAAELIYGLGGDDTINAGAGNDEVDGGDGDDTLRGGLGADNLQGGAGDDRFLVQGSELDGDLIDGGEGVDTLVLTGATTLTTGLNLASTGAAAGTLRASAPVGVDGSNPSGVERLEMGHRILTIDTVEVVDLSGLVVLKPGLMVGGAGANHIVATQSNDYLYGAAGDDDLSAGDGNDVVIGGTGADTLRGGQGNDRLFDGSLGGGQGGWTDRFVWAQGDQGEAGRAATQASDQVYGFDARSTSAAAGRRGDALDLRDLLDGESAHGASLSNYIDIRYSDGDTVLRVSSTGGYTNGAYSSAAEDQRITLVGVNLFSANGLGTNSSDQWLLHRLLDRGSLLVDGP